MKVIVYKRADGGVSVCHPAQGSRLAFFITLEDGTRLPNKVAPFVEQPVDSILRRWPVKGAVAEWAESEDQFLARVIQKSVPESATDVRIVQKDSIPVDRSDRGVWTMDDFPA